MPLFKKLKINVAGSPVEFRINVDKLGKFSCELPGMDISASLGLDKTIVSDTFSGIQSTLCDAIEEFNKLKTVHVYTVHYKFHISSRIKNQMPIDLMTDEMRKRTGLYGGSNRYYADDIAIDINWYPCVTTTLGKTSILSKMKLADESDVKRMITDPVYHHLFTGRAHKPFGDILFVEVERIWNFYNEPNFFSIPLTAETFEFFQGIEGSFVSIITKMLSFLSQDESKILEAISHLSLANKTLLIEK